MGNTKEEKGSIFYPGYSTDNSLTSGYAITLDPKWIAVDLQFWYIVSKIIIDLPTNCCENSARNLTFELHISIQDVSLSTNSFCGEHLPKIEKGSTFEMICPKTNVISRYVVVRANNAEREFGLTEIKVYGTPYKLNFINLYIGCFIIEPVSNYRIVESIEECMQSFRFQDNDYLGIRAGYFCKKVSKFVKRVDTNLCNIICKNDDLPCGSTDYYSIYLLTPCLDRNTHSSVSCSHFCKDNKPLVNGLCQPSMCDFGYEGKACEIRISCSQNGGCSKDECKELNFSKKTLYECKCRPGYGKKYFLDRCNEINECEALSKQCDNWTVCEDRNGFYVCRCINSYIFFYPESIDLRKCIFNLYTVPCLILLLLLVIISTLFLIYLYIKKKKEIDYKNKKKKGEN